METILEKIRRWTNTGKTVPCVEEEIQSRQEQMRRMAYERDVHYLMEDIEVKYPMLKGKREQIYALIKYYSR